MCARTRAMPSSAWPSIARPISASTPYSQNCLRDTPPAQAEEHAQRRHRLGVGIGGGHGRIHGFGSCTQYSTAGPHNAPMQPDTAGDTAPTDRAGADLIVLRPQGLYCPAGDFYIDPWRPVDRAVITHAHADHARPGHRHYLCSAEGAGLLRARLGDVSLQTLAWGEPLALAGRAPQPAPGRPCARLGAGARRTPRPGLGGVGRLLLHRRRRAQPHLHGLRAAALPLLHHRIHLRLADLPLAAAGRGAGRHQRLVAAQCRRAAAPAC